MEVLRYKYRGYTIEIWNDPYPKDPRNWNNFGHMIIFHSRYQLGDQHNMTPEELLTIVRRKDVVALPLYLMDHSGLTICTVPDRFAAADPLGWDWGLVGYIYVTHEEIRKEFGVKRVTPKLRRRVEEILEAEVRVYDHYLQGLCFGFTVYDPYGEIVESVGGYYGWPEEEALPAAVEVVNLELSRAPQLIPLNPPEPEELEEVTA